MPAPTHSTLAQINPATHGNLSSKDYFEKELVGWSHVLIQVAHTGQAVTADLPGFRLLPFCRSIAEAKSEKDRYAKSGVPGEIFILPREPNQLFSLGKNPSCMRPGYQKDKRTTLMRKAIKEAMQKMEDFVADYELRERLKEAGKKFAPQINNELPLEVYEIDDKEIVAAKKAREEEALLAYNKYAWVKAMREMYHVSSNVLVKPGAASTAVADTVGKYRLYAEEHLGMELGDADKWAQSRISRPTARDIAKQNEATAQRENMTAEEQFEAERIASTGHAPVPQHLRRSGQNFAIVAFLLDNSDEMEPGVLVLGYCDSVERGEELVKMLAPDLEPLALTVCEMYQWMSPYLFEWHKNSTELQQMKMGSVTSDPTFQDIHAKRRQGFFENSEKVKAVRDRLSNNETLGDRVLRILGITQSAWHNAIAMHGEAAVYKRIFTLPSIRMDVRQLEARGNKVVLGDIFTENRCLTSQDKAEVAQMFGMKTHTHEENTKLLEEMLGM